MARGYVHILLAVLLFVAITAEPRQDTAVQIPVGGGKLGAQLVMPQPATGRVPVVVFVTAGKEVAPAGGPNLSKPPAAEGVAEAIREARGTLELDRQLSQSHRTIARASLELRDYNQAISAFETAISAGGMVDIYNSERTTQRADNSQLQLPLPKQYQLGAGIESWALTGEASRVIQLRLALPKRQQRV